MLRLVCVSVYVLLCANVFSARMLPPPSSKFHPSKSSSPLIAAPNLAHWKPPRHDSNELLPSPADHRVKSLPGLSASELASMPQQYAGMLPVTNGRYFYWLFEATKKNKADVPLVIWLNGGPGCSSMDGLFAELGPLKVKPDLTLELREHAWNQDADLLFVDQPAGTGLSYALNEEGYCLNQDQVNQHFYEFLLNFLTVHSQYKNRPLYLAGESYAGHYIPAIATYLLKQNEVQKDADLIVDILGVAIGNGWSDPYEQYGAYGAFAHGMGLISESEKNRLEQVYTKCKNSLDQQEKGALDICGGLLDAVLASSGSANTSLVNMYDVRDYRPDAGAGWPPVTQYMASYLNRPEVRKAVHVDSDHPWKECDNKVNKLLEPDNAVSIKPLIAPLLHAGLRVLFYNGQFDLICNHVGTERFLMSLNWTGSNDFARSNKYLWVVDDVPAGYSRSAHNLTYLVFLGGSHMVPMDRPASALDMLARFLNGDSFADSMVEDNSSVDVSAKSSVTALTTFETAGIVLGCVAAAVVVAVVAVTARRRRSTTYLDLSQPLANE